MHDWEENLYLTENLLGRNKIWSAKNNTVIMCHICAKDIFIQTLINQFITTYQYLKKLPQISHIHRNRNS